MHISVKPGSYKGTVGDCLFWDFRKCINKGAINESNPKALYNNAFMFSFFSKYELASHKKLRKTPLMHRLSSYTLKDTGAQ